MSDYLTNLAAQSLESVPTVQPRLRSRFEPWERSGAETTSELTATPENYDETLAPATLRSHFSARTEYRGAHQESPDTTIAEPKMIEASTRPMAMKHDDGQRRHPEPTPHELTAHIGEDAHRSEPEPRSIKTRAIETERSSGRTISPSPVFASPRVTPLFEDRDKGRFEREEKQTAKPTIQVTIGRVEVRAGALGPPPKPRAAPAPPMSLDDYLRRRGNGGDQ